MDCDSQLALAGYLHKEDDLNKCSKLGQTDLASTKHTSQAEIKMYRAPKQCGFSNEVITCMADAALNARKKTANYCEQHM